MAQLIDAGLGSLPGTAAEILDDEVRRDLCHDKINTAEWFEVINAAHEQGLKTTATIMFGHIDRPVHWARHLLRLLDQPVKGVVDERHVVLELALTRNLYTEHDVILIAIKPSNCHEINSPTRSPGAGSSTGNKT